MGEHHFSRRDFFRATPKPKLPATVRPPWTTPETLGNCISCGDCAVACSENIIAMGADDLPFVRLDDTGCTFCGDCANACSKDVFRVSAPAWQAALSISENCLLARDVTCQICTDFCDTDALQFDLGKRPVGGLRLDPDTCTGCGFCVGACPAQAISLSPRETEMAA